MRNVAALEREVLQAGDLDIVDIGGAALNQARIFAPLDARTDELRENGSNAHRLLPSRGAGRGVRGVLDGVHDVLIAGAAAEIARDALANLVLARLRVIGKEIRGAHDHPRRTEAALQAVLLPESCLQRMQLAASCQALDRDHSGAVSLNGEHRARFNGAVFDQHGTRAALARVAADVRPGQVQLLAEEVHQQRARLDVRLAHLTVNSQRDLCHERLVEDGDRSGRQGSRQNQNVGQWWVGCPGTLATTSRTASTRISESAASQPSSTGRSWSNSLARGRRCAWPRPRMPSSRSISAPAGWCDWSRRRKRRRSPSAARTD